jgi:hypothetical protein
MTPCASRGNCQSSRMLPRKEMSVKRKPSGRN